MGQTLAVRGGEPLARLETPAWPVHGLEEERRLLQVLHDGPWAGRGPMETAFAEAWAQGRTLTADAALRLAREP